MKSGLMLLHGNHSEVLRDALFTWIAAHPLSPLENEVILVQSSGINQWLKLALARDKSEGGIGISAALDIKLPECFFWQVYRAVLGKDLVPELSQFDRPLLIWRLIRLLPELLHEPVFAPLMHFLKDDSDMRKLQQLAQRLADLFNQYQVYRADWLEDWALGLDVMRSCRKRSEPVQEDLLWQPQLWRALLADVGEAHRETNRSALHQRFLQYAKIIPENQRPAGLPARLSVFGISYLPQQSLEVLLELGRWTQIFMCVHNPCTHYWGNIITDKNLVCTERARELRKSGIPEVIAENALHQHEHPLLAAWGKQGENHIRMLGEYAQDERYKLFLKPVISRIDLFSKNGEDSLLHQLQQDILELRPLTETKNRWPALSAKQDDSLCFYITHSAQREVEVLHDNLLAALAVDPTLKANDIIVMMPDINGYAPHIQAVFGLIGRNDPRYIPFTIADQKPYLNNVLLRALERLLKLPQSRFSVSDLLELLEVPSVRQRFAIEEGQLPLLQRWISTANVRWGLHAEQRQSLGLPLLSEQNSWLFGLQRMLLGYMVGSGDVWQDIEPLDEIGGLDAELIGSLANLLSCLDDTWRELCAPVKPQVWGERLHTILDQYFSQDDDEDALILLSLHRELETWIESCKGVDLQTELPLSMVREHWLAQFSQPCLTLPFFCGTVTFSTLMPMRVIPFRHVYLLGMNDAEYPRKRVPVDFDLMRRDYRSSDYSRRADDHYLFLETLLSARERLHISWIGYSIHDNSVRPPSVLVSQLRDHIAAGWKLDDGDDLLNILTTEHRLQPFNRDYFSRDSKLFSYAHEWRSGIEADTPVALLKPLKPVEHEVSLTIRQLSDFLSDPVRSFFRQRLKIYFELEDPSNQDYEPFDINALETWRLQDELICVQKMALNTDVSRQDVLYQHLKHIERRGELAQGKFADVLSENLAEPMGKMFNNYQFALDAWPQALANEALNFYFNGVTFSDWLGDLRANQQGARARVVLESRGIMTQERSYRFDKLLTHWVAHLAGHLNGQEMLSIIVSKNGTAEFQPLKISEAEVLWQTLIDVWQQGQLRPLPLAVKTAFVWLRKNGTLQNSLDSEAMLAARDKYDKFERDSNRYLARAWPDFTTLWSDGEFSILAEKLLAPIVNNLSRKGKEGARK